MAFLSDLKRTLENVLGRDAAPYQISPIKFSYSNTPEIEHKIVEVLIKGKSWKVKDEFGNETTVSSLDGLFQFNLYRNLLALSDSRSKPLNYENLTIESK